jgi:hypothetical protein
MIHLLLAALFLLVPSLGGAAQDNSGYRLLAAHEVRLEKLQPSGWRISLPTLGAVEIEYKSFIAGDVNVFKQFYVREGKLVGLSEASGSDAAWIWDLNTSCQLADFRGFGMTPSPDGRHVAFTQFSSPGFPLTGAVVRTLDIDGLRCRPGETWPEHDYARFAAVGEIVLPRDAVGPQPPSTLSTHSPWKWIGESLVFVTLERQTHTLVLNRYDPATRRLASRVVDWTLIAKPGAPTEGRHPADTIAFKTMTPVVDELGTPLIRMRLAYDYLHRVKWVDIALPEFDKEK